MESEKFSAAATAVVVVVVAERKAWCALAREGAATADTQPMETDGDRMAGFKAVHTTAAIAYC